MTFQEWVTKYDVLALIDHGHEMREAWNAASEAAAAYCEKYAARHNDIRQAALEVCAEHIRSEQITAGYQPQVDRMERLASADAELDNRLDRANSLGGWTNNGGGL